MYLQVETRTSSRLHLKRAPGIRSWSLLVGSHLRQEHREGCFEDVQPLQEAADSFQSWPRPGGGPAP
ncbi:chromosome 17 open reading frame 62, isoform CRA_b [Homo sapiens]|uniref:Chromosome 17 open reading frame 62, isoform CRA_b n=1 Tax=Homo sapiens TaxID=9606 RepID=A0A8V8TMR8_HUMAN|nr:chromosome 17 open reading frame 62, isoform CRA_b [Homo sapiens]